MRHSAKTDQHWCEDPTEYDQYEHRPPRIEERASGGAERDDEDDEHDELEREDVLVEPFEFPHRRPVAQPAPASDQDQHRGGARCGREQVEHAEPARVRPDWPVGDRKQHARVAGEEEATEAPNDVNDDGPRSLSLIHISEPTRL